MNQSIQNRLKRILEQLIFFIATLIFGISVLVSIQELGLIHPRESVMPVSAEESIESTASLAAQVPVDARSSFYNNNYNNEEQSAAEGDTQPQTIDESAKPQPTVINRPIQESSYALSEGAPYELESAPLLTTSRPDRASGPQSHGILRVPAVGLEEIVTHVPLVDGVWDVNNLGDDVGLLEGVGMAPGDQYSMAFVGHMTTEWPVAGPFARLGHLSLGDEVSYQNGDTVYIYKISRFLKVDPRRGDLLFRENGDEIILVTCDGYDLLSQIFQERLIAIATFDRVEPYQSPSFFSR